VFGANAESAAATRLSRLFDQMHRQNLVGTVSFCDVTRADALQSLRGEFRLYVFLLDRHHLSSNAAAQAAYIATRKAVTGRALIIPLLIESDIVLGETALGQLSPLIAHSGELDNAMDATEQLICDFTNNLSLTYIEKPENNSALSNTEQLESAPTEEGEIEPSVQAIVDAVSIDSASQIAETVDPLPCHMSGYDDFVEQLIGRLQVMRMHDRRRNLNLFSEAVHNVLGAEMVYCFYRSKNGELHLYEAESNRPIHDCNASTVHSVLEEALKGYSHDLSKRSLRLQNFLPQLSQPNGSNVECMVAINQTLPNCGVFIASKGGFTRFPMTEILSTIINTVHDALAWASFETFEKLKARVYDTLRREYRYVSSDMYQDRRRIFKNQITNLSVQFEPMFHFDKQRQDVSIYAYEALARENSQASAAPAEVFNTASLWGMSFQSELDSTLLATSLSSYEQLVERTISAGACVKPLSLNVYPATLRSAAYRGLLYESINNSTPLAGQHLIMEVSEKTVVSPEAQSEARKQLEEYRDVISQLVQMTGVKFALDDFGVGNSSLSRLDRLKPHYVKIDRDILSFDTQMASTLIKYLVESQQRRGARVILEGVDIHSKLTLSELVNDIGVGIVQGHALSKAVSHFDPTWEHHTCERVKSELGWNTGFVNKDAIVLH